MARPQNLLYFMRLNEMNLKQRWKEGTEYLRWRRKYAKQLEQFRNIHEGEDCFIIGNGPSLKNMDLAPLQEYHTFGLNKIYLMFEKVDLNLSYLVSVNKYVIEQSKNPFEQLNCPVFLSYTDAEDFPKDRDNLFWLYALNTWSFYEDITQPICKGYTVTFVAMQIAYFMGFKRVFLIGVDHSFKQSIGKENQVEILEGDDENHFHPDYFKGQQWELADVYGNEVSYHLAQHFYLKDGRKIYNATVGGKLDVYPRVTFENALEVAKKKV